MTQARVSLPRFALLSTAGAVLTIALKAWAWWLTDSVGLLSDALESLVNLAVACLALVVLVIAARPPDPDHPYGHEKAEYFSSGVEGVLVLLAAIGITASAVMRLIEPHALEQVGLGMMASVGASLINLLLARVLLRAGRRHGSVTLQAGAQHLMTDVWTTVGVLTAVALVWLTGWLWLDPVVALLVAAFIMRTGWLLAREAVDGLMDKALPTDEQARIHEVLGQFQAEGIRTHALRTRRAGTRRFVSMHVLVPGAWSVQQGHDLLERLESRLHELWPSMTVFTHLEPLEDPASWHDTAR